jgi:23S rRNA (cytidine1920-2'-O)/16S rRNA (cytidine1409-2'-O)-methyltransferase
MMKGRRLDVHLAENKLSESREKARREIIAGWVKVNGETVRTPSRTVKEGDLVRVERPGGVFVSRGGEKIDHALERFGIDLAGKAVADLGASTGGFTHCMLLRGARVVYAVDVGYGQLDYRLRQDPAVRVLERMHVKDLVTAHFDDAIDFVTADLSFISIIKVFERIRELFSPAEGLILIKPQFEAGPGEQKKGVVRSPEAHRAILGRVLPALMEKGLLLKGLCHSPIKGPKGNIEFFAYFSLTGSPDVSTEALGGLIDRVVEEAHAALD